jgi:hypothetical protein
MPRLERPLLVACGGISRPTGLFYVIHYFTHGGNNRFAGVFNADHPQTLDAEYNKTQGNVFSVEFSRQFGRIERNADELKQAVERVKQLTGAPEVDVVLECKAAIEGRKALQTQCEGIRNAILLVPPNHGLTFEGNLSTLASKLLHKKLLDVDLNDESREALKQFRTDWRLGPLHGNRWLEELNKPQNLIAERKQVHSLTVIGGTANSLFGAFLKGGGLPMPIFSGDSMVPEWSAFHPLANNFFYDGKRSMHGQIQSHPQALAKMAEAVLTDGAPVKDEHYRSRVASVRRVWGESLATIGGFASRLATTGMAAGAMLGPLGLGLGAAGAGVSLWDGIRHLRAAAMPYEAAVRHRALAGGLGRLAQAAGTTIALCGMPWIGVGVLAAGVITTFAAGPALPASYYSRVKG